MPSIGPMEMIVILVIALLVLGPKRLPEAGRGIGRGMREFKDGVLGRDEPKAAVSESPGEQELPSRG